MPDWVPGRLGAYYLYFAHHNGTYIRLAYAEALQGPWRIHPGGVLSLANAHFSRATSPLPDVHVDEQNSPHRDVFPWSDGEWRRKARRPSPPHPSTGCISAPRSGRSGPSYARIFRHDDWWYGFFGTEWSPLYRSSDGLSDFEQGPVLLPALRGRSAAKACRRSQESGHWLRVYYTRQGDAPERIFYGTIDLARGLAALDGAAKGSNCCGRRRISKGPDLPHAPEPDGPAKGRENALRDPAIFEEDGRTWLLYAVAGESGIALAELRRGHRGPSVGIARRRRS